MLLDNNYNPDPRVQKSLTSIIEAGFSVSLYCAKDSKLPNFEDYNNFKIYRIFDKNIHQYYKINLDSKIDFIVNTEHNILQSIIFANDHVCLNIAVTLKKRFPELRLIYDAHEYIQGWHYYQNENKIINRIKGFLVHKIFSNNERKNLKYVDNLITVSDGIANLFRLKNPSLKIEVIRNVPPKISISKEKVDLFKKNLNLPKDKLIIAHSGVAYYSEDVLIWFFDCVARFGQELQIHFLFIANDKTVQRLKSIKNFCEASIFFSFHPYVEYSDLVNLLNVADCGLILNFKNNWLSHWFSLPNRIFDYTNAELALLSTPQPEFYNFIKKAGNGVFFDINDTDGFKKSIIELIDNLDKFQKKSIFHKDENTWEFEKIKFLRMLSN
jgi:glycosyltransferase involved in cell wall biosynthesis